MLGQAPGSPWVIRLLSLNKCRSAAGSDDWAFRASKLFFYEDDHYKRVLSVRIGATGTPVHAGDRAVIVVDTSAGTAPQPTWKRVAVLRKRGKHLGARFIVPMGGMKDHYLLIQGRTSNGRFWRIRHYDATWTYRAFTR